MGLSFFLVSLVIFFFETRTDFIHLTKNIHHKPPNR